MKNLFDDDRIIVPREDEYLDPDTGLVTCRQCGGARQRELDLGDRKLRVRCLCSCQTAAREQDAEEAQRRELMARAERYRSAGMTDATLWKYTFDNDAGYNPEIKIAKKYVENWDEMRSASMGLLLWGGVGTGKTYMAACIANALLDQGVSVRMTNLPAMIGGVPSMFSGQQTAYIDSYNSYQLLIIDDLGVERGSEFAMEQVYNIVDSRYRARLPMIITTNLPLSELKNPDSLAKARIYDRILERCVPVRVNNCNIRQANARMMLDRAKQLLT